MTEHEPSLEFEGDLLKLYSALVRAYSTNVLRANEARLTQTRLSLAVPLVAVSLQEVTPERLESLPEVLRKGLEEMASIQHYEYDAWAYVGRLSLLVYCTTLFDTFLQDTVEFLLCVHPGAIGDSDVSFAKVLKAGSRGEILNVAVKAKVKEVGFLSFTERLQWLHKRFNLQVSLPDEVRTTLLHYAEVRNTIVHDQGYFDFCLTDRKTVALRRRSCPHHPTPVTSKDVRDAKRAFAWAVSAVAEAVFVQILKQEPHESIKRLLGVLRTLDA
jgi:hypothetical protein